MWFDQITEPPTYKAKRSKIGAVSVSIERQPLHDLILNFVWEVHQRWRGWKSVTHGAEYITIRLPQAEKESIFARLSTP